jgi:hypothetical protein
MLETILVGVVHNERELASHHEMLLEVEVR